MYHQFKLFTTGFLHVAMVALSTYCIAHRLLDLVFIVGFIISWLWAGNVKKIAISGTVDRVIYSAGAAIGSVCGTLLTELF